MLSIDKRNSAAGHRFIYVDTVSLIPQWQSVGFNLLKPKTLQKWYQQFPCLALNIEKGNTGSFSKMDKIWDRNPSKSEVIGCRGGMKKTNDHAEPTMAKKQSFYFDTLLQHVLQRASNLHAYSLTQHIYQSTLIL